MPSTGHGKAAPASFIVGTLTTDEIAEKNLFICDQEII
jgi:hypothetical protein